MTPRAIVVVPPMVGLLVAFAGVATAALAAAAAASSASPAAAAIAPPAAVDTLRVRWEVGAATDVSNEVFYEEAFSDTTFLGRQLVSAPETRYAGVLATAFDGTRGRGAQSYSLRNELGIGDRVRRDALSLLWHATNGSEWGFDASPRIEYRRDETFGRDLEQWTANGTFRARRDLGGLGDQFEIGGRADFSRTAGASAAFLPDRNAGGGFVAFDHEPWDGATWRVEYGLKARAFPDSIERDHLEHELVALWRQSGSSRRPAEIDLELGRRSTIHPATTSRDRFMEGRLGAEGSVPAGERFEWRARVEAEALHYDEPDSLLYFDYQIARAALSARLVGAGPWTLGVGPRAEALLSRWNRAEAYRELGGAFECEYLSATAWWSLTPAAGWRAYDDAASAELETHSSFAYYELTAFGEQSLPGALRARLSASGRFEFHGDDAQDARSVYLSLDVRRLF